MGDAMPAEVDAGRATVQPGRAAQPFTVMQFTKAFIAELVANDAVSVRPRHPSDRKGFSNVVHVLDQISEDLEAKESFDLATAMVDIANELRPSNTGAFEGFEAALRAQQLTFARCPNPFYEEIEFPVPKVQAVSIIERLPSFERDVIRRAVTSFLEAKVIPA